MGRCAGLIGAICNSLAHYDEAAERYAEALEIDRQRGDRRAEAVWLIGSGELSRLKGDYEEAAAQLEEALEIQRSIGDVDQEALTLSNLGGALMGMGDFAAAI
ncbi:MAG: tetratricopeptide repeat protein, partial [Acidimicrobiia bacterium]|nr:tetratricopeptide repeat protein [Acidimicrobiia bacterium]